MTDTEKKELIEWLNVQLAKAEQAVRGREEAEKTWREGSDRSWRAVGCKLNKADRHP